MKKTEPKLLEIYDVLLESWKMFDAFELEVFPRVNPYGPSFILPRCKLLARDIDRMLDELEPEKRRVYLANADQRLPELLEKMNGNPRKHPCGCGPPGRP